MIRFPYPATTALVASALAVALMAAASPAMAATGGWSATLKSPLPQARQEIVNSVLWKCAGAQCAAPEQGSRPVFVCQKVVRKFGPLSRFTSPEGELSADDLAKCNG